MAASFSRGVAIVLFHHNIVQWSGQDGAAAHRTGLPFIGGVEGSARRLPDPQSNDRSDFMKYHHTARATLFGATAAALLAATTGMAAADNAAPTTPAPTSTTQPSQQQTGVTEPAQQPGATISTPASATTTKSLPSRTWMKRAERGTNTHGRGQSH